MSFKDVITPDMAETTIKLMSDAVSQGSGGDQFDIARKLLALAIGSQQEDLTPEATASMADGALFDKSMALKVSEGQITEEEAAESMADRRDSAFVTKVRSAVAVVTQNGCEALGTAIGAHFGHPEAGRRVGNVVGHFLNKPVSELAAKGARKLEAYARQTWKSACENVGRVAVSFIQKLWS